MNKRSQGYPIKNKSYKLENKSDVLINKRLESYKKYYCYKRKYINHSKLGNNYIKLSRLFMVLSKTFDQIRSDAPLNKMFSTFIINNNKSTPGYEFFKFYLDLKLSNCYNNKMDDDEINNLWDDLDYIIKNQCEYIAWLSRQ